MLVTSFWHMMDGRQGVRIPIIQRDYAQGRRSHKVDAVRKNFLDSLHAACSGGAPLLLDFVYGENDGHELLPFDGQQRLTTLFLLHWYAAARQNLLHGETRQRLGNFRYEVRDAARLFVQMLLEEPLADDHPVRLPHAGPPNRPKFLNTLKISPGFGGTGSMTPPFRAYWSCWTPSTTAFMLSTTCGRH